ncbi:MAG: hypothetical protein RR209_00275, partial [Angelakisella sp.]
IKGSTFPNPLAVTILAARSDYLYENNEGQLTTASGMKWSNEDGAWVGRITRGKNFIIADRKIRSAPYGSGINEDRPDSGYVEDDRPSPSDDSTGSSGGNYYNPDTGGGSGTVAAVAGIVAILAISLLSVVMSSLISLKEIKRETKQDSKRKFKLR